MTAILENVAAAAYAAASAALLLVAVRAARHAGTAKVWTLTAGFALLFAKAALLAYALFTMPDWGSMLPAALLLDVAAMTCFYAAMFR